MSYLRNYWYVAGWSADIAAKPVGTRILDLPVVLFRTAGGRAAALDDCCPHRMVPLSQGTVDGESLRCGYHGLRFDCAGACVEIPGQKTIPPQAKVRSYPLVERWNLAWIWMGDPERADPELIPALPWLSRPDWAYSHGQLVYECSYVLLLDNLIDLSHTTFVHQRTIGTDDVAKTPVTTTGDDRHVLVERLMNDTEPSILYRKAGDFTGRVDRWQRIEYRLPTHVIIDAGAVPAGSGNPALGIDTRVINLITPQTATRTAHYWAFARNFRTQDTEMTDYIARAIQVTFEEDMLLINAQQTNVEARPAQRMLDNAADAGVVRMRRLLNRLLTAEAEAASSRGATI